MNKIKTYSSLFNRFRKQKGLILLALPGLLFILAFNYLPILGIIIPFKDINIAKGILGSDWAGLKNFEYLFTSQNILRVTRNTVGLNLLFIFSTLIVSVSLALILNSLGRGSVKIYQTSIFIPYFISWVVASYVVYALLNPELGVVNKILRQIGVAEILWYMEAKYWPGILMLAYLWKFSGYYTLLYYTGLIGQDPVYYEAATIDGANKFHQIWYISLPLLSPLIIMLVMLQVGRIFFADFGMFYFLPRNSGALYSTIDVIDTFVFRSLRVMGDIGMAGAAGLYQTTVGLIMVLTANWAIKKINTEKAIF